VKDRITIIAATIAVALFIVSGFVIYAYWDTWFLTANRALEWHFSNPPPLVSPVPNWIIKDPDRFNESVFGQIESLSKGDASGLMKSALQGVCKQTDSIRYPASVKRIQIGMRPAWLLYCYWEYPNSILPHATSIKLSHIVLFVIDCQTGEIIGSMSCG